MLHRYLTLVFYHLMNGMLILFALTLIIWATYLSNTIVKHRYTASIAFVSGFFTISIAVVGCVAVIKKNILALGFYIVVDVLFITGMVVFGLFLLFAATDGFVVRNAEQSIQRTFEKYVPEYPSKKPIRDFVDRFQTENECCGVNGPEEWLAFNSLRYVPASCCDADHDYDCSEATAYQKSCKEVWVHRSMFHFRLSIAILWTGSVLGVVCVLLAVAIKEAITAGYKRSAEKKKHEIHIGRSIWKVHPKSHENIHPKSHENNDRKSNANANVKANEKNDGKTNESSNETSNEKSNDAGLFAICG